VHHQYTPGGFTHSFRIVWISLFLVFALGITLLIGCESETIVVTQPTETAQQSGSTQPLISAPFFTVYEFDVDEGESKTILGDDFCCALSISFSEEYLAGLKRFEESSDQLYVSDGSGNPIYPDYMLTIYNYTGELLTKIYLSDSTSSAFRPLLALAGNGDISVLSTCIDWEKGNVLGTISVYDTNGDRKSYIANLPLEQQMAFLTDFCVDNAGNYYIAGENMDGKRLVAIMSSSGNLLEMYPVGDVDPEIILPSSDGLYVVSRSYSDGDFTSLITPFSSNHSGFGEEIVLPDFFDDCNNIFIKGEYVYGSNTISLKAFSLKTRTMETVLEWNQVGMSFFPASVFINSSGAVVATGAEYGTSEILVAVLSPSMTDPHEAISEIIVGVYDAAFDDKLMNAVKVFNQNHSNCRIVLRDYAEEYPFNSDDYKKDVVELNQQMFFEYASGNPPDIFIDVNGSMGLTALETDSYLIDLYPYIKNDPDIKLDNYYQNALFSYATNGKLYMFPCGFFTRCFYGNPEVVGKSFSWTFSDYYELEKKLGSEIKILTNIPKMDLLEWTLVMSMKNFSDLNTGRVSFDSEDFADLLNWVDTYGSDVDTYEVAPWEVEAGKLAIDLTWIDSPFFYYINYFTQGYIPTYMGYPNSTSDGLPLFPNYVCAITTGCENPDLAWDFVSLFLQDDVQSRVSEGFIPVSKEASAKQVENFLLENQEDGFDVSVLDMDFWNSYYDILERVDTPPSADYMIIRIVMEESASFFAGQKTVAEVVPIIQNRVRVYVDERMK